MTCGHAGCGGGEFFDGVSVAVWIEGSGTRATGRPIDLDCAADALLQDAAAEASKSHRVYTNSSNCIKHVFSFQPEMIS